MSRITFTFLVKYGRARGFIVWRGKNKTIQVTTADGSCTAEFKTVGEAYTDMYYNLI